VGSEHTINGKRLDLEMQTFHVPQKISGGIKYAAVSLLFSVNEFTKEGLTDGMVETIDAFFESVLSYESD
jgi:hypothetical protein